MNTMTLHTLNFILNLLMIAGGVFALYGVYFCVVAAFGLKKRRQHPAAAPTTRFAVVVAARNEQDVVGHLVDSLKAQNYPANLVDIYVAPNNCTDDTRGVALEHGAKIFDPEGEIRSKGEVLTQITDMLLRKNRHDAVVVFDADNLVHPDFLQRMNDAYQSGVQVAQGQRDCKNPTGSAMATCYAVYYWIVNRFYNGGREALGLSGLVVGSGYMASLNLLRRMGGWHTSTMTEDYEFSAQCVLAGEKVHYIADAVAYDELPLTFATSWKQRRRWCTGFVQGMEKYAGLLMHHALHKGSGVAADLALVFIAPALQFVSLLIGITSALFSAYGVVALHIMPVAQAFWLVGAAVVLALLGCSAFAGLVAWYHNGHHLKGLGRGIAMFAFFLLSWLPISLLSLFHRKTTWDAIHHSHSVDMAALGEQKTSRVA